jgi:hypothetical protein
MKRDLDAKGGTPAESGDARNFSERRRVIQCLATMPVLLTLSSGARGANASSYQCIGKDPAPDGPVSCGRRWSREAVSEKPASHWVLADYDNSSFLDGNPRRIRRDSICSNETYPWRWKYVCFNENADGVGSPAAYPEDSCQAGTGPATNSCYASFG